MVTFSSLSVDGSRRGDGATWIRKTPDGEGMTTGGSGSGSGSGGGSSGAEATAITSRKMVMSGDTATAVPPRRREETRTWKDAECYFRRNTVTWLVTSACGRA